MPRSDDSAQLHNQHEWDPTFIEHSAAQNSGQIEESIKSQIAQLPSGLDKLNQVYEVDDQLIDVLHQFKHVETST